MNPYFDPADSMASQTESGSIPHVLSVMAQRYIGDNPPHGPVYRVTRESGIRKLEHHVYEFPVARMFPEMQEGQYVYAWAKLWIDQAQDFIFFIRCHGPVRLFHNGEKRFGSSPAEEGAEAAPLKLKLSLTRGWNHFVLELAKGAGGACGAEFGTSNRKNKPFHFLAPSKEREGEEGWLYTAPLERQLTDIPQATVSEKATEAMWLPVVNRIDQGRLDQLFGNRSDAAAYAWTTVVNKTGSQKQAVIRGRANSPLSIQWQGRTVHSVLEGGEFTVMLEAPPGSSELLIRCSAGEQGWGFQLEPLQGGLELAAPRKVHGYSGSWLYLGPFPQEEETDASAYLSMDTVASTGEGTFFWMTDQPGAHVRPFLENELFGKWNYPLGVTLSGLLETGKLLQRSDLIDYVTRHVEFATSTYAYSLWDRERFGAAGLNNQLSHIDSLDDCGSFGALAITASRVRPLKGASHVFDDIAEYIMNVQDRMEDGALYRRIGVSPNMHNTMWCDDMYMSVPFLCRYAELTGDSRYIDEAARQLLLYKKYLFIPERSIMAHVFDVSKGLASKATWGRGNGWVFFSLAVLLGVLPETHERYDPVLAFYRELAEGYRKLQGRHGLWHQVLIDHESYEEASCTSMFIYGFALGVRHGWLEEQEPYVEAVLAGWQGLCERAIDKRGNLYGVCKGSGWSHSNAYYKHDLGWNLNDTHGIGIVLLAGIETERMIGELGRKS
ncbi:glycoside hydrolase family 88 protein [Paenibacillus sp. GD4]|uniref:glycoside hydrolase family 88/105 protein n=1 Tax=Paenibacillus sp. GD4 TaxID=3068890 RepID=UPI0027966ACA|nr:glycoside hydrolase family 88 protein [Paenibacillus sp. GD4]MDQ1913482.1 glycoside hydrolase family 88 protein [Paenibacillus sp. GD4]